MKEEMKLLFTKKKSENEVANSMEVSLNFYNFDPCFNYGLQGLCYKTD